MRKNKIRQIKKALTSITINVGKPLTTTEKTEVGKWLGENSPRLRRYVGAQVENKPLTKNEETTTSRERILPAGRAGDTLYLKTGKGVVKMNAIDNSVTFRSLGEYGKYELLSLKFRDDKEADRALVLIGNSDLNRMPFLFADELTFIVPKEAVGTLLSMGLEFEATRPLDMDDLTMEERATIRLNQSL